MWYTSTVVEDITPYFILLFCYRYFVFYLREWLRHPYRYGTKYNVARKLAKRNGSIIYAEAGRTYPTCHFTLHLLMV